MKIKKSSIILTIVTLYGVDHFLFERSFFFNELLSLIGFAFFIKHCVRTDYKIKIPNNAICHYVLLFILLGGVYAIASFPFKTNWYYYLRNLSMIYSVFSFFVGYYLYEYQFDFFSKIKKAIYGYAILRFMWIDSVVFDRTSYTFWFTLLQKDWKVSSIIALVVFFVLYIATYTALTVVIILVAVLGIRYMTSYARFKLIVILIVFAFGALFYVVENDLKLYHHGEYRLFGDVQYVYAQRPLYQVDGNSSWRLLFWYRLLIEKFPENLVGIGLGTPIIPYRPFETTTDLRFNDEYVAHVIGAHNTFVTVFVRLGVLSIVIMIVIYRALFREYFFHKKYYFQNKNDGNLFMSFISISVLGLFNLVIESPTMAALFWISLGFVAKAIYVRQTNSIVRSKPLEIKAVIA